MFPRPLCAAIASSAVIVVLTLGGCAPEAPAPAPSASATAAPAPTPTPTPEAPVAPVATQAVLTLDGLVIRDQFDTEMASASFAEPDAVLALLGGLLGSTPEPLDQGKFGVFFEWPEVSLIENFGTARLVVRSATIAGIPIATGQGIRVGSSRADVLAAGPFDIGSAETLGLEPRQVDGFESLVFPGQPGTAYIAVFLEGDVVTSLRTPSGDYLDI